ncbi:MAG: cell division protein FtsH, partial [Myxococcales bacterium]|nr:cell division protein FtsH [Myxococcales bacterium]
VCEWGMSERLGPLVFGRKEEAIFLGREIAQHKDYSESTAIEIDREVREIVQQNYDRARRILQEEIELLHAIAQALLERETLDRKEIDLLLRGEPLPPLPKIVPPPPSGGDSTEGSTGEREEAGASPGKLSTFKPQGEGA